MSAPPDIAQCYRILEVSPGATDDEIRKAYRDLAAVWHPDRISGNNARLRKKAEQRLKQINVAYEILRQHGGSGQEQIGAGRTEARKETAPVRDLSRGRRRLLFLLLGVAGAAGLYGMASFGVRWLKIETDHRVAQEKLAISADHSRQLISRLGEESRRTGAKEGSQEEKPPIGAKALPVPSGPASRGPVPGPAPLRVHGTTENGETEPRALDAALAAIHEKIAEARRHIDAGDYEAAESAYMAAQALADEFPRPGDRRLVQKKEEIAQGLASGEIRYGARGYVRYNDRWFSPEAARKYFVAYKGQRRYYRDLKDPAERLADGAIRSRLAARFADRIIHKKMVECFDLSLLDNGPDRSRYRMHCRWEAWIFDGVERATAEVLLDYDSGSDRWRVIGIRDVNDSSQENRGERRP